MVWSWKKKVDVSDDAGQRLRANARHPAHYNNRLPIGIPPLANRATVRVGQAGGGLDGTACNTVRSVLAGMVVTICDGMVRTRNVVVTVIATGKRVQTGIPGNRNHPMQGQQQNGNRLDEIAFHGNL
jgi:hypothetical protein